MTDDRRVRAPSRNRANPAFRSAPCVLPLLLLVACTSPAPDKGGSSSVRADGGASSPGLSAQIDPARVSDADRITLVGSTHAAATRANDRGLLDDAYVLEHLQLILKRPAAVETTLVAHIDALHDPASPVFHQWLDAPMFGATYGVARADIDTIVKWLVSHGMRVESVPTSQMLINFTATAKQIREAFHTEMHALEVRGKPHISNVSDLQIPAAFADVVVGVYSLHDFLPHPLYKNAAHVRLQGGQWHELGPAPAFTYTHSGDVQYDVAPADFAAIYNLNPLYSAGINGAGVTIAVIEDTNVKAADVTSFRTAFGLPVGADAGTFTFTQVHPTGVQTCTSPGTVKGAEAEAALDSEWAGAAAPGAAIELVSCADTTEFGGYLAFLNLIAEASPPPIISLSYGECEPALLSAGTAAFANAYQQAVAEGISVFVSSGDEGADSCDADAKTAASAGISVSGMASSAYNVAVGGTDFMDVYQSLKGGPALTTYWTATNASGYLSALSYLPEMPWNETCAGAILLSYEGAATAYGSTGFCNTTTGEEFLDPVAGSGGVSVYNAQPTWQTGAYGLPTKSGGMRYLPDVSLFASAGFWGHAYIFCNSDKGGTACTYTDANDTYANSAGGTSFAAPALAGIQALINQYAGGRQGNPAYGFYKLATEELGARGSAKCNSSGGTTASPSLPASTCIFRDVTEGDIDMPCTGANCYDPSGTYGVLSTSTSSYLPAYPAGAGWDYATGLGTVNAYNLVHAW